MTGLVGPDHVVLDFRIPEVQLHPYVHSLPGGVTGWEAPGEQGQAQDESREPCPELTMGEGPSTSAGSLGHPVLCKRPCVHVAAGRFCAAGSACNFCHLCDNRGMRLGTGFRGGNVKNTPRQVVTRWVAAYEASNDRACAKALL